MVLQCSRKKKNLFYSAAEEILFYSAAEKYGFANLSSVLKYKNNKADY